MLGQRTYGHLPEFGWLPMGSWQTFHSSSKPFLLQLEWFLFNSIIRYNNHNDESWAIIISVTFPILIYVCNSFWVNTALLLSVTSLKSHWKNKSAYLNKTNHLETTMFMYQNRSLCIHCFLHDFHQITHKIIGSYKGANGIVMLIQVYTN